MMELQLMIAPSPEADQEVVQEVMPQEDQELSAEQSLQLVKIFLNSSIACVCYTRELLRWTSDCLQTRYIEQVSLSCDNSDQIYDNFLNARSESPTSQQVRVLVRSKNERANAILDMLEYGVFDALRSTYLDTLQVFVATNSTDAKSVLETYTYHFEYEEDRVTSVRLGETDQAFTSRRSQKSFKAAIRGLLRAMQELPRLPKKSVLGMSMSYKDGCPKIYEPLGFTDASDHTIAPDDWHMLWATPSDFAASFESTHHNVKVAARGPWSFDLTTSQLHDTLMSKQLQNMQKTSSSHNHALASTVPANRTPEYKRKETEDKEAAQREPKRRRETIDGTTTEFNEPIWSQSKVHTSLRAGGGIQIAATDEDFHDQGQGSSGVGKRLDTPRRRKKSISKTFVATDGSTPVSQRYTDETANEQDYDRGSRHSRASSSMADY